MLRYFRAPGEIIILQFYCLSVRMRVTLSAW